MKNKIAIVTKRYGLESNGGAEYHARTLAHQLQNRNYEVEILTSNAIDYNHWTEHYAVGKSEIENIKVRRFACSSNKFKQAIGRKGQKRLKFLTPLMPWFIKLWINGQGPYMPTLKDFIQKKQEEYEVFIFFTYLYYPTVALMPLVGHKSIFIPTVHNERNLYYKAYENLFSIPKYILYNSESEKNLVLRKFKNICDNSSIVGLGIDDYNDNNLDLEQVLKKYNITSKYLVYIGRVCTGKGCDEMIDFFIKNNVENLQLVVIGQLESDTIKHANVVYTEKISDEEKHILAKNSLGFLLHSFYESLSLVTLEAMNIGLPVIVNSRCEVLVDHIENSKAGFIFHDFPTYKIAINKMLNLTKEERKEISQNGKNYVKKNYQWNTVLDKFDKAIDFVVSSNKIDVK